MSAVEKTEETAVKEDIRHPPSEAVERPAAMLEKHFAEILTLVEELIRRHHNLKRKWVDQTKAPPFPNREMLDIEEYNQLKADKKALMHQVEVLTQRENLYKQQLQEIQKILQTTQSAAPASALATATVAQPPADKQAISAEEKASSPVAVQQKVDKWGTPQPATTQTATTSRHDKQTEHPPPTPRSSNWLGADEPPPPVPPQQPQQPQAAAPAPASPPPYTHAGDAVMAQEETLALEEEPAAQPTQRAQMETPPPAPVKAVSTTQEEPPARTINTNTGTKTSHAAASNETPAQELEDEALAKWNSAEHSQFFSPERIKQAEKHAQKEVDSWLNFDDEKTTPSKNENAVPEANTLNNDDFFAHMDKEAKTP